MLRSVLVVLAGLVAGMLVVMAIESAIPLGRVVPRAGASDPQVRIRGGAWLGAGVFHSEV